MVDDAGHNSGLVGEGEVLLRQAMINWSGWLVSGIVGLVMVPVMLRSLGGAIYGLWIAMESTGAMLSRIDLGLPWAVTREIASVAGEGCETASDFVSTAASISIIVGASGWICMALLGRPIGRAFGSPGETASLLFAIGGAVFLFDSVKGFAFAVLRGARRFGAINALTVLAAILWGTGAIMLLRTGRTVIALIVWQALCSALVAMIAVLAVVWKARELKLRVSWPTLRSLQGHVSFSLFSQILKFTGAAIWEIPTLLIGVLAGSSEVAAFFIGRVFPSAAFGIAWRSSEVLFPAASQAEGTAERSVRAGILDVGTRLNLVVMVPISIVLWVLAPGLLKLWVGSASKQCVEILRILLIAELFDAAGLASSTVLWGMGTPGTLMIIDCAVLAVDVAIGIPLVFWMGGSGAAIALAVVVAGGSAACLKLAATRCGIGLEELLRSVGAGLGAALAICVATAILGAWLLGVTSWSTLLTVATASAVAYALVLRHHGARPEEARLLSSVERLPFQLARSLAARR